jgi:hypothetical protein
MNKITVEQFWEWFVKNERDFFLLNENSNEVRDSLLQIFLLKLHQFNSNLYFEIGGFPYETQELVISACGNKDFFVYVEELVSAAPVIKNWKITAFKQPKEIDFITEYNGLKLVPDEIWFKPQDNDMNENSNALDLYLYVSNFDESRQMDYINALYLVLDNLLGEYDSANNIGCIEVINLPKTTAGLNNLKELAPYIDWIKTL